MLPISLRTEGHRALIVGGGSVALRKAATLLGAGMTLVVIAPRIDPRLEALLGAGGHECIVRTYQASDISGITLVIAATDDENVNAQVVEDARRARILVCDATEPERGDFTMQATLRVGELTFSVDSGKSSPAFSKRLLREIEERFGGEYDAAARTLARMRTYVRTVLDGDERTAVMRELADFPIDELAAMNVSQGEHEVEAIVSRMRASEALAGTHAVICATRASALALTQSKTVAARLALRGIATTLLNVTTMGDRIQDKPIAAVGVNVWVKELEVALLEERADYAVHSCKDLPGELTAGMRLAAISVREDARDAFCSERYESFDSLPSGAIVGTSSQRRRAFLETLRPDLRYENVRGNVDTRLRKLREGQYDAIVLALAGLRRLGTSATYTVPFEIEQVVPAVGQGALAIETRAEDEALAISLREAVNDHATELCVTAERAVLRKLRAGCNAPLGVHASLHGEVLTVESAFAQNGTLLRERSTARVTNREEAERVGTALAERLATRMTQATPKVLLPRTQDRPSRIAAQLRSQGVAVVEFREGEEARPDVDLVLFPSSGSVAAARAFLDSLRTRERRPRIVAMGPASGAAAREAGFDPDFISADASIDAFVSLVMEQLQAQ